MKSSVKKNFIYNSVYQILVIIIPLITTPYLSRIVHAKGIGIYSYAYTVAYYFVMIGMLGLNNYGNRTIAMCSDDNKKLSKAFWSIYAMQIVSTMLIVILYIFYLIFIDNNIMGWLMLPYVISTVFDINWFFFGIENFKIVVIRNSIIKILSTICIFIFIKHETDIYLYGIIF